MPLSRNLGALSSWNHLGLSRPVVGLLYLFTAIWNISSYFWKMTPNECCLLQPTHAAVWIVIMKWCVCCVKASICKRTQLCLHETSRSMCFITGTISGSVVTWEVSLFRRMFNLKTPNVNYSWRTAPLTSKVSFFIFFSTNIVGEYFKHDIYSPFFPLQNAFCFIILTYLVSVLFTFYIQGVTKLKKIISAPNV